MLKSIKKIVLTVVLIMGIVAQSLSVNASVEAAHSHQNRCGLEPITAVLLSESDFAKQSSAPYNTGTHKYSSAERDYWTKFSSKYYYNFLSTAEKEFWDSLEDFCITLATTTTDFSGISWISCDSSVPTARIRTIVTLFIYSNPQYYFLEPYITYAPGGASLSLYTEFRDGDTRSSYTEAFTSVVDKWVTQVTSASRPEDKIKLAHDIVCKNANYIYNEYDQSAFSMVYLGKTTCVGYAKVLSMLANAAGIETAIISSSDHAWNIVKLHDVWYELDSACDDGYSSNCYYDFYNKSRATFSADQYANHNIASMYAGMIPYTPYDIVPGSYYLTPYFTVDGNTYFIINSNTSVGDLLAICIDGTNAWPETVTYQDETYTVIGGSSSENGTPDNDSATQIKAFVARMYTVALGRTADTAEIDFWFQQLITGKNDGAGLAQGFILSPEFRANGYNNTQYIQILYKTFLNRDADTTGLSYWTQILSAGHSREFVLSGFVNSDEFNGLCSSYGISKGYLRPTGESINPGICLYAERLYTKVLEREGEKDGMEYWAVRIADGICTPEEAAESFFLSTEYLDKQTSDEKYIMALYRTFMNREAELNGLLYWEEQITNDTSRQIILKRFAQSAEFQEIIAEYGL